MYFIASPNSYGDYKLDGVAISWSDIVKYLGIVMDKFHVQTSIVVAKGNLLGIIKRSFEYLDDFKVI